MKDISNFVQSFQIALNLLINILRYVHLLLSIYSLSQLPVFSCSAQTTLNLHIFLIAFMFIRINFRAKVINLYEKDDNFNKKVTQSLII